MEELIHFNVVQKLSGKAQEAKVVKLGSYTFNDMLNLLSTGGTGMRVSEQELALVA